MGCVISLSGLPGVGKDTVAVRIQELSTRAGRPTSITSIAHPLKLFVQTLYGYTDRVLFGPSDAREGLPPSNSELVHYAAELIELPGGSSGQRSGRNELHEIINGLGEFPSARRALQNIGMWGREYRGADVWVSEAIAQIEGGLRGHGGERFDLAVVPDLRFGNEVAVFREQWGLCYTAVALSGPLHARRPGPRASESDLACWHEALPLADLLAWNSPATGDAGLSAVAHTVINLSEERAR